MINLRTGAPGAGKTLLTIKEVMDRAESEKREVYYSGIKDLQLPWTELDNPADWHKVPAGSIVVIDECQREFRPRMHGAKVPESIEAMETHRHGGIDLYLITQHPMLVDTNIRRLVGNHRHIVSAFGMKAATVHEWQSTKENCDKARADSSSKQVVYPKQVYKLYKSAEVHTHKMRIPFRVWVLLFAPILAIAAAYYGWQTFKSRQIKLEAPAVKNDISKISGKDVDQKSASGKITQVEYLKNQIPRIVGQPYTAPQYDAVTTIAVAPIPSVCYLVKDGDKEDCRCKTQQGTKYETTDGECRKVVKDGFFQAWGGQQAATAEKPSQGARSDPTLGYDGEPFPRSGQVRTVDADSLHQGT